MNQYIITEEQLKRIIRMTKPKIYEEDLAAKLVVEVRSHPYNPQAEQVGTDGLTDSEYEHTKLVQEIEILHDRLQAEREKVLDELVKKSRVTTNTDYFEGKRVVLVSDIREIREGKDGE